jgi:AraC-like DNA-binding protein/mannose-6-phosphate isomerase-like protein (cupin superfamily)
MAMPVNAWASVDPLGEALHFLRMSGIFYTRSEFSAPWGLALPEMEECLMFHVVTAGRCWLEVGGEQRQLHPGDLALVPHGKGHLLISDPGARPGALFDLPREQISERYEILRHGGGGAPTHMICGAVKFDHPAARQLIALLPKIICIEAYAAHDADGIQSTLRFMASEAQSLRPGGETVITRLADILVIQTLRAWMTQDPAARTGWLGALQDKQVGRAIALIHRDPGRAWSVAALAGEVAMSRSAFAARFTELLGEPVMAYVTRWRMHVAVTWLQEERAPVGDLADRLGYDSEAAFSRAFKRIIGVAPGAVRKNGPNRQQPNGQPVARPIG